MAMLEAFVYDPLISWRLLGPGKDSQTPLSQTDGDGQLKSPMDKVNTIVEESDEDDDDSDADTDKQPKDRDRERASVTSPTAAAAAAAAGGVVTLGEGLGRRDSRESYGDFDTGSGDHENVNSR